MSMGYISQCYCRDCADNKKEDCNAAFKKVHDEAVLEEAFRPKIKHDEIDVRDDYFQYIVQNKQEPELEMCFRRIAEQVYLLKTTTKKDWHNNWRWIPFIENVDKGTWQEVPKDFVEAAIPYCYDRLKTYDAGRATAKDYFTAACCGLYEYAKLHNWRDWAY